MYPTTQENKEIFIAEWEISKWIVLSSSFLLIPPFYSFINGLHLYGFALLFSSLISMNFWRRATYSWRRTLDLVYCKGLFILFLGTGLIYVKGFFPLIAGYSGLFLITMCYNLSCVNYTLKTNSWYMYHMAFHFFLMVEQLLILYCVLHYI